MVYLHEMPEAPRNMIVNQDLPDFGPTACADGPPLKDRKIAIITTAGLHRREDKHFSPSWARRRRKCWKQPPKIWPVR
jgi:D-proline reductase (dithiol) PrdB